MRLSSPITIKPPPYSQNGQIINPSPMELENLNIVYCDYPPTKQYFVKIDFFPNSINLFYGDEYDKLSPINKELGENRLREILGDDPAKVLRDLFPVTLEEDPHGPGTLLSGMIKALGIVMTEGCSCRRHAIEMNKKGNDWCEENIDTIVSWLREEAIKRNLPFIDAIGKLMIKRAIKKSRRLLANQNVPENDEELDNIDN